MGWTEKIVDMIRDRGKGCYYSANMVQWRNDDLVLYRIYERLDHCEYDVLVEGVKLEQAIEMTLGREECKVVSYTTDGLVSNDPKRFFYLSCGHWVGLPGLTDLPKFCPECGRKVNR